MSEKRVCLCQWDYIFNFNENKNDNGKIDRINKNCVDLEVGIEINTQNIACFSKTMPLRNKHTLGAFDAQFIKKISNTEAELKKSVVYKKSVYSCKKIGFNFFPSSLSFQVFFVIFHAA